MMHWKEEIPGLHILYDGKKEHRAISSNVNDGDLMVLDLSKKPDVFLLRSGIKTLAFAKKVAEEI
jgi:hypothetical protein